jgi:hypothetical protein
MDLGREPSLDCPRFQTCSVNICPLAFDYETNILKYTSGDFEKKCTMAKSIRIRIGRFYGNLKYGGLTRNEFAQKNIWELKPIEEQKRLISHIVNYESGKKQDRF